MHVFPLFNSCSQTNGGRTYRRTDEPTDGPTDGQTKPLIESLVLD